MSKSRKRKRNCLSDHQLACCWEKCFSQRFCLSVATNEIDDHCSSQNIYQDFLADLSSEKNQLNNVKSQLNSFDIIKWRKHTTKLHKCGFIVPHLKKEIKAELVTQAWAKFYTILSSFDFFTGCQKNVTTVHLCEAPGAFVTALNHYLQLKKHTFSWNWTATTLNPYYEGNNLGQMIPDDRFIIDTLDNWLFGPDNSGNIMNEDNLMFLKNQFSQCDIPLVTADGSVDCSDDPANQENHVSLLFLWEVVTALSILSEDGSFVLKIFTIFEVFTISLLHFLKSVFHKVTLFKPGPSKPGNSEVYVINQGFLKVKCSESVLWKQFLNAAYKMDTELALVDINTMSVSFLRSIKSYVLKSCSAQKTVINDNVKCYEGLSHGEYVKLQQVKNYIATRFVDKFGIHSISNYLTPKLNSRELQIERCIGRFKTGSYTDRVQNDVSYCVRNEVTSNQDKNIVSCFHVEHGVTLSKIQTFDWIIGKRFQKLSCSFFYDPETLLQYHKLRTVSLKPLEMEEYGCILKEVEDVCTCHGIFNINKAVVIPADNVALLSFLETRNITICENTVGEKCDMSIGELNFAVSELKKVNVSKIIHLLDISSSVAVVIVDDLIFSYFWHGVLFLLSNLYEKFTFCTPTKGSLCIVFLSFQEDTVQVGQIVSYLNRIIEKLDSINPGDDILHVIPIDLLLKSSYYKFATMQMKYLLKQHLQMQSV